MDLWMVVAHCSLRVGDEGAGEEEQTVAVSSWVEGWGR